MSSPPSLSEAIKEGVENYLAIAFERGSRLPPVGDWEGHLRADLERRVRSVYQSLDTSCVVPPDFLWDLEHDQQLVDTLRKYYRKINMEGAKQ